LALLLKRIVSAAVAIPIVLGAVYLGGWYFTVLVLLLINTGIYEYTGLLRAGGYRPPPAAGYAGATLMILFAHLNLEEWLFPLTVLLFAFLFLALLIRFDSLQVGELALLLWGIIYLGGLGSFIVLLRAFPRGALITAALLIGVWVNDSCAFFIGSKWGRHRLAPKISPNKSVQGALGGLFGTLAVALGVSLLFPGLLNLSPGVAALLAIVIALFSQLGDLLESALKRQLHVKDSGNLIPGHGGVLDRIDSVLFTAPPVYYFFKLMELL
jgi:phosphatidate cytidylyltransferase